MRPAWSGLKHQPRAWGKQVVCGRTFCPECGRWRPVSDFSMTMKDGQPRARPYCQGCFRARNRASYVRMDGQRRELWREYQRIWAEGRRRRRGVPVSTRRKPSVIDTAERVMLDPAPLVQAMRASGLLYSEISQSSGVPERTLLRIRTGESRHVRLDVADKVAVALGLPLSLLYPFQDDELAAVAA